MEDKKQNEVFQYNYSAKQQAEVERIRKKYLLQSDDKMERLRALDASVTRKGTAVALVIGILGALIMGIGMCLIMTELGDLIGAPVSYVVGIGIGLFGMVGVIVAYPLYVRITERERRRISPEILRLSEELMK